MVIDSSAVLAILFDEPEAIDFLECIQRAGLRKISAASYLETGILLSKDSTGKRQSLLVDFLSEYRVAVIPVTEEQAQIALQAFHKFGKGKGHPARLNFGDCFVYALASATGETLLFKGNDFSNTNLQPAL